MADPSHVRSPFPGMDPYLERHWRDVHTKLIVYACNQLQDRLPGDLCARAEERVYVEPPEERRRGIYPDVRVIERRREDPATAAQTQGTALAEPLVLEVGDEQVTERCLEIMEAGEGGRVITVIEFVSPTNKFHGQGRELYLRKQSEVLSSPTSLVEIDLVRGGEDVVFVPLWRIPETHRSLYRACVRRGWKRTQWEVYPLPLRAPLPAIRIPLRETDQDIPLDLQRLIDDAYRTGRYETTDYSREPAPPLEPDDAAWADAILRARGLR